MVLNIENLMLSGFLRKPSIVQLCQNASENHRTTRMICYKECTLGDYFSVPIECGELESSTDLKRVFFCYS